MVLNIFLGLSTQFIVSSMLNFIVMLIIGGILMIIATYNQPPGGA